ncbi:MAG: Tol-Pal system beta propeller repeat protein TolB [Thermodesulfobacteriota bacterium]
MKFTILLCKTLILFTLLFCWSTGSYAGERVYIDITSPESRKINVAVPSLINKDRPDLQQPYGRELADILGRSLEFHGMINVVDSSVYGNSPQADWKQYGVDYVVLGSFRMSSGGIGFELKLLDVAAGLHMMMGKTYNGARSQQNEILFRFCDSVIEEFTGEPGVALSKIVFISNRTGAKEIYITDILGLKTRQVTRHKNLVVSPRFTPDGRSLTYTSYHTGNQNLYITDLNQNKTTRALSRRKGMNLAPAWSPDGKKMVLTLSKDGNPDLYLLDARGYIKEQLTKRAGINVSPTWSPNGRQIAFVSDRSARPQIYTMDLSGRRIQRLTFRGSENAEPAWSPKGDQIAYSSLINGQYQIFTIRPDANAEPIQVTHGTGHHESPTWSPDGRQLIYSKRLGKGQKIMIAMKNGSQERQLFDFSGNQSYPRWSPPQKKGLW